jgi:dolichyl-phosphate beta-glucosyltransferase
MLLFGPARPGTQHVIQRLSIVIPAHNEAHRIESTVQAILDYVGRELEEHELIVVDDASTDGTADLVRSRFGDQVVIMSPPEGHGKGAAVRAGVLRASLPWVLFVDADLPVEITNVRVFSEAAERADIVIASKRMPGSTSSLASVRKLGGRLGNLLISTFVVGGIRDTQCGFKIFRTDVARSLFEHQRVDGFGFDFEVLFLAKRFGYHIVELPAEIVNKAYGTVSLKSYAQVLWEVGQVVSNRILGRYPKRLRSPAVASPDVTAKTPR